ncbi:MAG: hypothetical protein ABL927_04345 [Bdellovibrionales bacterium]
MILPKKFLKSLSIILLSISVSYQAQATPEREFIMSCTYGVLAGTLVGAASLAFIDKPGDNLQRVARGASLGLYVGIGLGFYTAYLLPKQMQKEEDKMLEQGAGGDEQSSLGPMFLFPLVAENGVDGIGAFWQVKTF